MWMRSKRKEVATGMDRVRWTKREMEKEETKASTGETSGIIVCKTLLKVSSSHRPSAHLFRASSDNGDVSETGKGEEKWDGWEGGGIRSGLIVY